jgi:hypothetical protein
MSSDSVGSHRSSYLPVALSPQICYTNEACNANFSVNRRILKWLYIVQQLHLRAFLLPG